MEVRCAVCGQRNRLPVLAAGTPRCGRCHTPLPWVVDAGDAEFQGATRAPGLLVLVDLWAPWCGPCKLVEPALHEVARAFAGQLKVVRVNVDQSPQVSERFDARSIPTLVLLRDEHVVDRVIGALPANRLTEVIRNALEPAGEAAGPTTTTRS
jgi:thioredoxin 2